MSVLDLVPQQVPVDHWDPSGLLGGSSRPQGFWSQSC